ncbi:MAG: hypothetical protein RLZZ618_3998 [Pseudomonadota bacterium]|jgi:type VI secretion system secreted protein Hcp
MKDIYIDFKAGDIKGESVDSAHKDTVEASTFSHIILQPKPAPGAPAAVRVEHGELTFTKNIDSATPALMVACSASTVIKDVDIHFYRATEKQRKKYLQIKLKNAVVASVGQEVGGSGLPVETFSLKYSAIEWTYDEIKADGSNGKKLSKQWSIEKNAPSFA